jgi:hypothetical protein
MHAAVDNSLVSAGIALERGVGVGRDTPPAVQALHVHEAHRTAARPRLSFYARTAPHARWQFSFSILVPVRVLTSGNLSQFREVFQ